MISATTSTTSSLGAAAGSTTAGSKADLASISKNQFLTLLVAQLKNQDPMNPLQPYEFAAQLAQFTSVEQLQQLNQAMTSQLTSSQSLSLLGQTNLAASLIGRNVVAEGGQVVVPDSGHAKVQIEVGGTGGKASLRLLDSSGNEVATRDLGAIAGGAQTLALPADLPAGAFHYEIKVTDASGAAVSVVTYTTGTVDAVAFKDSQIVLQLGAIEVPLDTLTEIEPAVAAHEDPVVSPSPSIKPPAERLFP
jgi:flagellar basal-body rod modification protein FlgD